MAERSPAVSTLFKLAFNRLITDVKIRWNVVDPDSIPITVHTKIWNDLSIFELIKAGCHNNTRKWVSQIVQPPRKLKVWIRLSMETNWETCCTIGMAFPGKPDLLWHFVPCDPHVREAPPMMRVGPVICWTKLESETPQRMTYRSYVMDKNGRTKIIDQICMLFGCQVDWMNIHNEATTFEEFRRWERIRNIPELEFDNCEDLEFLLQLRDERQQRNLDTKCEVLKIDEPITIAVDRFKTIPIESGYLNLTQYSLTDIIEYSKTRILNQNFETFDIRTTHMSAENLEHIKTELNLLVDQQAVINEGFVCKAYSHDYDDELCWRLYFFNDDGSALLFYFLKKAPGSEVYDRMKVFAYDSKSKYPEQFQLVEGRWTEVAREEVVDEEEDN